MAIRESALPRASGVAAWALRVSPWPEDRGVSRCGGRGGEGACRGARSALWLSPLPLEGQPQIKPVSCSPPAGSVSRPVIL